MRVAVGVTTRRRPEALERLLASLAALEPVEGVERLYLVCENDERAGSEEVLERFRSRVGAALHYRLEPRRGIPHGRNAVLDMAEAVGAEWLLFVDDDEVVPPGWLDTLLGAARARELDLAGGPVMPEPPGGPMSPLQRALSEDQGYRLARQWRKRAEMVAAGTDGEVDIYTNNWCLRVAAARDRGLRFDPALADSGGEDTAFCHAMRAAGARTGWVPAAGVTEMVPIRRLTARYHYQRMRDQVRMQVMRDGLSPGHSAKVVLQRGVEAAAMALAWPVLALTRSELRWRVRIRISRKRAIIMGHLSGHLGARSRHYGEGQAAVHEEPG